MNRKLVFTLLLVSITLTGCADIGMSAMEAIYQQDPASADKHEGPTILANTTQEQMLALAPAGMTKEKVIELLGAPASESQASDNSSISTYRHTFTSLRQRFVKMEYLTITFGADKKVSKANASVNSNSW